MCLNPGHPDAVLVQQILAVYPFLKIKLLFRLLDKAKEVREIHNPGRIRIHPVSL
jgi:hypothetical protein